MPTSFQDSLSHLTTRMVDPEAWLLTHDSGHPAAIARSTGYFSKSIQLREALDEAMPALIRAGVSHDLRSSRDQRGAHLIQSLLADLDSLLG